MTHEETGLRQAVPVGFSWTTLFFGFFVPLIRGDFRWAAIMFVVAIAALVAGAFVVGAVGTATDVPVVISMLSLAGPLVTNVVFAMRYNAVCAAALVERGFKPTGALGRGLLAAQGIGVRDPVPADVGPGGSGQHERSDPGSPQDEGRTDPAAPASDPARSGAQRSVGGMKDGTRKVVATAGGVLCVVAALLPYVHVPVIGAVPWSFFDGEPRDGVFVAAAGVVAILLGLLGRARGWNLIPSFIVLAVAIAGIVGFTDMLENLRSATAEEDLGIFEGLADMAIASVSLGAAAPTAIVGAIVILASAVASRRWHYRTGQRAHRDGRREPKETASRPLARPIVTAFGAIGGVAAILWAIGEARPGTETRFEDATPVSLGDTVPGVLTAEDENHFEFRVLTDGSRLAASTLGSMDTHGTLFTLVISKTFLESDPVQLPAVLAHDANGDTCEAYPTESHVFDLALVRTRYRQFYGPGPGKVVLRIAGVPGDDLVYEFDG